MQDYCCDMQTFLHMKFLKDFFQFGVYFTEVPEHGSGEFCEKSNSVYIHMYKIYACNMYKIMYYKSTKYRNML